MFCSSCCRPETLCTDIHPKPKPSYQLKPVSYDSNSQDIAYVLDDGASSQCSCLYFSLHGQCEHSVFCHSLTVGGRTARLSLDALPATRRSKGRKWNATSTPREQRSTYKQSQRLKQPKVSGAQCFLGCSSDAAFLTVALLQLLVLALFQFAADASAVPLLLLLLLSLLLLLLMLLSSSLIFLTVRVDLNRRHAESCAFPYLLPICVTLVANMAVRFRQFPPGTLQARFPREAPFNHLVSRGPSFHIAVLLPNPIVQTTIA